MFICLFFCDFFKNLMFLNISLTLQIKNLVNYMENFNSLKIYLGYEIRINYQFIKSYILELFAFTTRLLHSICQQIWKTQQWPQDWKRSVFIPIPKKGNAKECWNYHTIALISHASKVMLKILQARLQQYVNRELPDVQAGFKKGRGTRDQIANIHWIIKKAIEFQKNIYFCFIVYAKAFDCVDHNKLWKIL